MKITFTILVLILLLGWTSLMGATPTITLFTPASGAIGSSVTITGTNFNTTAAQNIVFFGATQAEVTAASAISLTVTVPLGATYQYLSVTDLAVGLTAYSAQPFIVTLNGSFNFTGKVDFTTGTKPYSVSIGDLDDDGKPDLAVANYTSNTVSVFRNTSTSGTVSFATAVNFTTGTNPYSVSIGDIDGDGKLDLAVANYGSTSVSVFRNTSTSGNVSFATAVDFTTGINPISVSIGDIDGDGKPDLAVANFYSNTVSVFRNTSTSGSITSSSFAAKVDFITGKSPYSVSLGDIDGNGKADLAVANYGRSTVSVFHNISTSGTIDASSFAAKVDFTTGTNPSSVCIGDIDGDGKPDLAVANNSDNTVSVLCNTSTSGSITSSSFAAKVDFTAGSHPQSVSIGDIDGDGKPDLAVANVYDYTVSVLRSTSTSGSITSSSFATKVDFSTGANSYPYSVSIGDLDGDGKPDLVVVNYNENTVSVIRQTNPPTITSFTPASAASGATVTITGTYFTGATAVSFGGTAAASFSVVSATSITAVVASGTSGSVSVTTPGGTATFAGFTFIPPSITSFTPATGAIGSSVTISGTGFNTSVAQNIVFFGATQTVVTAATATSLTVTVPLGATYQYLSVTNLAGGLTAYSAKPFIVTLAGSITFTGKVGFLTGLKPYYVCIGDIDGDGKADLVVVNSNANNVSVLRNTSTAGYVSFTKVDFTTGLSTRSVCIGDLDGDGKPDLAVANFNSRNVSVFLNTSTSGTVSFAAKVDYTTGTSPISVSIGDIDGDGKPDLAVADNFDNTVSVLRNTSTTGNLSFAPKADFPTGTNLQSVSIGDIDGDGKPDLVVAKVGSSIVSVLRNTSTTGNLSFATMTDFTTGSNPISVSIGDIDGDGKPDLAAANYDSGTVSVLRNTSTPGSVSFAAKVDLSTGTSPQSVSIGDIDGDGKADLAVANNGSNTVSVFRNTSTTGTISFADKVDFTTGTAPISVSIGDIDGDGKPDLTVANWNNNNVSVIRQITPPPISITSFTPDSGAIGSSVTITGTGFNTTAAQDIVFFGATKAVVTAATATSLTVTVPLGATYQYLSVTNLDVGVTAYSAKPFIVTLAGSFTFTGKVDFTTGSYPHSVSIGDIDGDGKADLVVANYGSASVSVLCNTSSSGTVSFATAVNFTTGTNPYSVSIGDIDGDGKADLAVANYGSASVSVLRNTSTLGSVSFATKVDFTTGTNPASVSIGDIDGDGKPDLALANFGSSTVSVFRNTSISGTIDASSFADAVDFTTGSNPISLSIGDLDGDGKVDLAVANYGSNTVSVLRNTSNSGTITSSSFADKVDFATGTSPYSVSIGDLNGDGEPDLAVANYGSSSVSILVNNSILGITYFLTKFDLTTGTHPYSVSIGDIDGDGKPDLAVANNSSNTVSVFRNTTISLYRSFDTKVDFTTGTSPSFVSIGDIDGDGKPDLAVANYDSNNTVSVIRQIIPAPSITSFTPASAGTGTTVAITGTYFTGATDVSFGGTAATSFNVVSATSITAVVATGTSGTISVTTPGGTGTLDGFTYVPPPTITSFTPTTAASGATVTITGTNFTGATAVSFGGTAATSFSVVSATSITAVVASGTTGTVSVTTSGGIATSAGTFTCVHTITSFTPATGAIGSSVTITGTNFNPTAAQNIVFFGATKAVVTAASATSLTVTVPLGATYQYLSVTNFDVGVTAYSAKPFIVTLAGSINFAGKVNFTTGQSSYPLSVSLGDIDGDGKADLAVANFTSSTVSVFRNTSTSGTVSFAAKVDLATGLWPEIVSIGDIDGDGKLDLASANNGSNTVSVFRNTSTPGSVSFATKVEFTTGSNPLSTSIGDFDGDGKPDLATANYTSNTVSVFRNTSTLGSVSFATKVDFATGTNPESVSIGDLDGDGNADLAVSNSGSGGTVSVFRNTSTLGSVSFATKVDFTTGSNPFSVSIGDLDGDGILDLAVANDGNNSVSVFRNTSTPGSVSFATKVNFTTGTQPKSVSIGDIDGDGKPDMATANFTSNNVSVFRNTCTSGSITSSSFATHVDFATGSGSVAVSIGDIDGNGKPDLAVANYSDNTFSVIRQILLPTITNFSPSSAAIGATVTITGTNFTGATAVSFGGTAATSFNVVSATSITAEVASGTSGSVSVTTPDGTAILAGFTHASPPTITSFTPLSAVPGATVTITGTNFTGASAVSFGGTAATSFNVVSATSITAVVASGTTGSVSVTTPWGTATLAGFTYIACTSPSIGSQSTTAQSKCLNGTFDALTVSATGTGLSYQWYSNLSNSNTGGQNLNATNGANTYSYTPQAGTTGTLYYYCVVTGTCGTATSLVSGAFIVNPLPVPTISGGSVLSTLSSESFENWGSVPSGWATEAVSGTNIISFETSTSNPSGYTAYNGTYLVRFRSFNYVVGNVSRLKKTVPISTVGLSNVSVDFAWLENTTYPDRFDKVEVEYSTNGTSWTTAGTFNRYNVVLGWKNKSQALPAGALGQANLYIAFKFTSAYGADCYLDLATITTPAIVYAGSTKTYSTETGMTGYTWAVSEGGTITSGAGTNSVNVLWNTGGAQTVSVNYTNGYGCTAVSPTVTNVTITTPPLPTITSFSPASSGTGATVTITGNNFTGATAVSFGGTAATSFNVVSATSITAVVASGTTGSVTVTTAEGTATSAGTFTHLGCIATLIGSQSTSAQTQCIGGSFNPITITATGTNLTYQWYSNTNGTNSGGTSLVAGNGAQTNRYTPQSATLGTLYYYCTITGDCGPATSAVSGAFVTKIANADLSFNGTSSYISLASNPAYTNTFTIEAWIKTTSTAIEREIVGWGNTSASISDNVQFRMQSGKLQFGQNPGGWNAVTGTTTINTGNWVHVAVVKNVASVKLYVNGTQEATSGTALSNVANVNTLNIGDWNLKGVMQPCYFPGLIKDVRIWNTARTASEIIANKNACLTGTETGLVAYYKMDEGTGNSLTNTVTGGSYAGTINNGTWTDSGVLSISSQSTAGQTQSAGGTFSAITVTLPAAFPAASYQWYSNSTANNTGGTSLGSGNGAQTASYVPQSSVAGTLYYYCTACYGSCSSAISAVSGAFTVTGTIPSAPTALSAIGGDGSATILFTAGSNGGLPITSYEYSTDNGSTWTPSAGITSPVTISGLTNDITYQVKLRAINSAGSGPASTAVGVKPFAVACADLSFNGTSSYISFASIPAYSNTFTVEAWIKSNSVAIEREIVGWGNTSSLVSQSVQFRMDAGKLQFGQNPDGWKAVTGTTYINTGNWVHVAVVKNGATLQLYVNGTAEVTLGTITSTMATINTMNIGNWNLKGTMQSSYFPGLIKDVRIWNTVRTANQISANKNVSLTGTETGLVAYYKMDEGGGTAINNTVTGGSYVGAINNGTWTDSGVFAISSQSSAGQTQCLGGTFSPISVSMPAAFPVATYQWYSNSSPSNSGGTSLGSGNGAQTPSYVPQSSVAGILYYYCTVDNGCCLPATSAVSGAFTTNSPTAIVSQSTEAQTQCINGTFSAISVTGTGDLAYQWYINDGATTSGGTAVGTNSNSYIPSATVAGTSYYYCVAHSGCGPDVASNPSGVFIVNSCLPEAPVSLSATPGNGNAAIGFTAGAEGTSAITNYEYSTDGSTWMPLSPADYTSPLTISGLTNGTTYTVYLRAVNGAGSGTASTSVSVTPVAPCANPTDGGTIASDQSGEAPFDPAAFTSTTGASGQTGTLEYKWRSSTLSSTTGFGELSSSNSDTYDAGVLSVTTWFKRLARVSCATDWTGAVESNVVKATALNLVAEPSAQPTKLNFSNTVTSGNTNIVLNYTASTSATNYLVVRKTGSAPTFVPQDGTAYTTGAQGSDQIVYVGTATSATDLTITKGTIYYYAIYAFNGSGESCNYLTANPLNGSSLCVNNNTGTLPNSSGLSSSAGFPDVGVNVTFPNGTNGTTLNATKTSNTPTSNLSVLPGVRGVSNLYFTITSSQPSPGTFILVLDFSGLGLTQDKWASFKIMKRTNSSAAWSDIISLGGTIANRCTDGVWGKFTITGLSSFSDFAGGEAAVTHTVTSASETGVGTLKQCILDAVAGDFINFNLLAMGTNTIKLTSPVVVNKDLTIQGAASGIVLDGNNVTKVLDIYAVSDPQPVVRLEKLTITKGNDTGNVVGGIENLGELTMVNCLVNDNSDMDYLDGAGAVGAISSSGNLTLINCTVAGNAGAPSGDAGLEGIGGIYCNGDLKIYNTIIYGNTGYYHSMASTRNIIESYDCLFEETYDFLTDPKENNNFFFQGNPELENKFSTNPKFVGNANNAVNPYLILGASPCVDGGNDTYNFDDTDIRGAGYDRKLSKDDVTVHSPIDIGAYEWKKGTDPNNIFTWTGTTGTDWATAGNWDVNDVPKPEDIVTVPNVTNKPEAGPLSVSTGGKLTIQANSSVTTSGAVTNNGTIIIRSDINGTGSLITSENPGGSGLALVERYMTEGQWHIISSPTGTQTIGNFLTDNIDIPYVSSTDPKQYGMMDYNPSTDKWNPYFLDTNTDPLGIGKGYMVRVEEPVQTMRFQGVLNATATTNVSTGWNCIGNPYTSAIRIIGLGGSNNFIGANAGAFETSFGALYFWNQASTKYDVVTLGDLSGFYASVGQGFFMKAKVGATSVSFTPAMQVNTAEAPFKATDAPIPTIQLMVESGSKKASTDIRFVEGATKGLDFGYDAGLFTTDKSFALYTKLVEDNGVDFQLQCLPTNQYKDLVIPIGIDSKAGGEIVFTVQTIQLAQVCTIVLEDKLTKTFTDLSTGSYKATVTANTAGTGRFFLHTADIISGVEDQLLAVGKLNAYAIGNKEIRVVGEVGDGAVATLVNGLGQVVVTKKLGAGSLNIIGLPNLSSGVYLLKVNDKGTPQTIKIMIRK